MKPRTTLFWLIFLVVFNGCNKQNSATRPHSVSLITNETDRKIDINIDGKLFTSFRWPENVYKPILYPVLTAGGTEITRGFPLNPREGERNDHIHQAGIWLNYGNVNGLDFWGNGHRGLKEPGGGEIRHLRIERLGSRKGVGSFVSVESWLDPSGKELLSERSEYIITAKENVRIIDRITTLTAVDSAVLFKDTKEGMFGIRVARQLELPSPGGVVLLDADGNPSPVKDTLNKGVTGNYLSSEGITGESVWGTRAEWMQLSGTIGEEKVCVIVFDHPRNPGYPTYWHARGYGLFAANPLGWNDFTKGSEQFNFSIKAEKSATFRYRVLVNSGENLSEQEIKAYADEFGKKYKRN